VNRPWWFGNCLDVRRSGSSFGSGDDKGRGLRSRTVELQGKFELALQRKFNDRQRIACAGRRTALRRGVESSRELARADALFQMLREPDARPPVSTQPPGKEEEGLIRLSLPKTWSLPSRRARATVWLSQTSAPARRSTQGECRAADCPSKNVVRAEGLEPSRAV
jgi:hypothetical protein